MQSKDLYYQKYLKYKNKYLNLQSQIGGADNNIAAIIDDQRPNYASKINELKEILSDLTTYSMINKKIDNTEVIKLAEALKTNTTQTTLNLQQNNIGDEGIKELAEALKTNTTLTTLNLQQNNIGDEGVKKLAFILFKKFNTSLKNIDLKFNNKITSNGVFIILKFTIDKSNLDTIELNNNIGFTRIYDILLYSYIQTRKKNLAS